MVGKTQRMGQTKEIIMSTCLHEDLPEGMKKRQILSHGIAEHAFNQTWDLALIELQKLKQEITGNDALAYFGTLICSLTARWLIEMVKIADKDDAGVSKDDLVKDTLNGIIAMLGGEAEFEEKNNIPSDGIKRLKNNLHENKMNKIE